MVQHILHFGRNLTPIILFATAGIYLLSRVNEPLSFENFWDKFDAWGMLAASLVLYFLNIAEFVIRYAKSSADNQAKFPNHQDKTKVMGWVYWLLMVCVLFIILLSVMVVCNIIQEKFSKQNDIKNNSDVSHVHEHNYGSDYEFNYSNKNFRVIYPKYTCILPFEIQEVWKNNLSYEIAEELENQILPDEKARTLQHKRMAERIKEIKNQAISSGVSVEIGNLIITCQPEMPKEQDNKQK